MLKQIKLKPVSKLKVSSKKHSTVPKHTPDAPRTSGTNYEKSTVKQEETLFLPALSLTSAEDQEQYSDNSALRMLNCFLLNHPFFLCYPLSALSKAERQ